MYKHFFKRFFDFWIALIVLICLSPILLIVTIWLHFANKGAGVFFLQERPGKDAKIFKVIKFKSMTDERDANGILLPGEQRITKIGRFIRAASLDELPQLFNILIGQMSFVGPRPGLTTQTDLIGYRKANGSIELTPGLTGLAQVSVGKEGPLTQLAKSELDKVYLDKVSFLFDLKIIFKTFGQVFGNMKARKRKG